jgi:hypothetical protein
LAWASWSPKDAARPKVFPTSAASFDVPNPIAIAVAVTPTRRVDAPGTAAPVPVARPAPPGVEPDTDAAPPASPGAGASSPASPADAGARPFPFPPDRARWAAGTVEPQAANAMTAGMANHATDLRIIGD